MFLQKSLEPKYSGKKNPRLFLLLLICFLPQFIYSQNLSNDVPALELNKPVTRQIAGNTEKQNYQIRLGENQFAKIIVEQNGVDVVGELFDADGNYVTRFNNEIRLKENESLEFVATKAGIYRIEIRAAYKTSTGSYKIQLAETRAATERDNSVFEAHKLLRKAYELHDATKYNEALPLAARALEIAEKELGSDNVFVSLIVEELGSIQREMGNYPTALSLIQRSIATNEKLLGAEHPQTVEANYSLGLYYRRIADSPKAERTQRQNLEIYERTLGKDHPKIAAVLNALGVILNDLSNDVTAESFFQRAMKITEENLGEDSSLLGNIINNLGVLYLLDRKDYDRAEQYLQRSLALHAKAFGTETSEYSNRLQNLGIIYRNRKQYAKALEIYERALVIREKILGKEHQNIGFLLNNIANIYKAKGDYDKALEIQQRVREIAEKSVGPYHALTAISIGNTATIYAAKGDFPNAVAYQKLWDERFEKIIALDLTIGSERQKLAYAAVFPGRTSRTISLHTNLARNYQTAIDQAALVVLQRKGRVLDAVSDNLTALRERASEEDRSLLERYNTKTAQLARLTLNKPAKVPLEEYRKQIAALESEKEKLEIEMNDRNPQFGIRTLPVTLDAVKAQIPADAALVEFAVYRPFDPKAENNDEAYGEPRYIAYVLRKNGEVKWTELGDKKTIDAGVENLRKALRDADRKDVKPLARTADAKIMQPVRALLGSDIKQIFISPDGELNLLPFQALVDEKGRYLIENYEVDYLTSGRDLLRMKAPRASKTNALVIADPSFNKPDNGQILPKIQVGGTLRSFNFGRDLSETYFAPLPGTLFEARSIQNFFPEATSLTGAEATKSSLKKSVAPRILHIATHGFFLQDSDAETPAGNETKNPLLRSGLAFAGANRRSTATGDDGIMTALETSGLNLWGTKLVVLSACDTGLGEVRNGEGVYGLRRAFILAGTESLVMSLWAVSDDVTSELMTNYYKNLKDGIGRGESLRQAQLAMMKKKGREHPFYWAAFIHSGEWANLDGVR